MGQQRRKPAVTRQITDERSLERYVRGLGKGPCTLTLPGLREEDARRWERLLSRLQTVCGCTAGLVAGVVGFVAWIAFGRETETSLITTHMLIGGLAAIVIPAVAAKLATLAIATARLRMAGRALLAELGSA